MCRAPVALALAAVATRRTRPVRLRLRLAAPRASSAPRRPEHSATPSGTVDQALVAKLPAKIKAAGKIVVGTDADLRAERVPRRRRQDRRGHGRRPVQRGGRQASASRPSGSPGRPSTAIILGVNSGKYDIGVSSFTINAEREKQANDGQLLHAPAPSGSPPRATRRRSTPTTRAARTSRVQKGTVAGRRHRRAQQEVHRRRQAGDQASSSTPTRTRSPPPSSVRQDRRHAGRLPRRRSYAVEADRRQARGRSATSTTRPPTATSLPKDQTDFGQAIVDALKALKADGSLRAGPRQVGRRGRRHHRLRRQPDGQLTPMTAPTARTGRAASTPGRCATPVAGWPSSSSLVLVGDDDQLVRDQRRAGTSPFALEIMQQTPVIEGLLEGHHHRHRRRDGPRHRPAASSSR